MTIASDFYDMAVEMLSDSEIGFDGVLYVNQTIVDPLKPWDATLQETPVDIRLFYTEQTGGYVNGSPVTKGEKVFICYAPEGYTFDNAQGWKFDDHTGKSWTVNAVESVGAGNETIILYLKIGV